VCILYEEISLLSDLDERFYAENRQTFIPDNPYQTSPLGFVKVEKSDQEWIDPRDRNRRICEGIIQEITLGGKVRLSGNPFAVGRVVDIV